MLPTLISILITVASSNTPVLGEAVVPAIIASNEPHQVIASHVLPLNDRYGNEFVNTVFKDNILLTLRYMDGEVKSKADIDWTKIESDLNFSFTLNPGEKFAFHDKIAKGEEGNIVKTTNAHFNYTDGFKSDGYLTGDGVCHLASVIYWVALDAGLEAVAPTNHDFVAIPDIPKEYGVAIYQSPDGGEMQNLYITNTTDHPMTFEFNYTNEVLTVSVVK